MAVLTGTFPETCYAKYGSMPLKSKCFHELALRILLSCVDSAANKHMRYIVPWISLSVSKIKLLCVTYRFLVSKAREVKSS